MTTVIESSLSSISPSETAVSAADAPVSGVLRIVVVEVEDEDVKEAEGTFASDGLTAPLAPPAAIRPRNGRELTVHYVNQPRCLFLNLSVGTVTSAVRALPPKSSSLALVAATPPRAGAAGSAGALVSVSTLLTAEGIDLSAAEALARGACRRLGRAVLLGIGDGIALSAAEPDIAVAEAIARALGTLAASLR